MSVGSVQIDDPTWLQRGSIASRVSGGTAPNNRDDVVLKTVVKKLAKQMLKKAVPKQVFDDCADEINKAFNVGDERMEKHKQNLKRINSRKLGNESQTYADGFFSP